MTTGNNVFCLLIPFDKTYYAFKGKIGNVRGMNPHLDLTGVLMRAKTEG